jgi:hypothetical protein
VSRKFLLDLFTPYTWQRFLDHGADVSGFKFRQLNLANQRGESGVIFLCYLVGLSRWCGALEIKSNAFVDHEPIFQESGDPYVVRFKVEPIVVLDVINAPPITAPEIWRNLTLTDGVEVGSFGWAQSIGFRASLREIPDKDGEFLLDLLKRQEATPKSYPLTKDDERKLKRRPVVQTEKGEVEVEVPEREEETSDTSDAHEVGQKEPRTSIQMQASLAKIGALMGFNVWIPASDRAAVSELLPIELSKNLLERLPLNYDDVTLKTIENIDVIWLQRRSMRRAFEVEHTTSIFSGLLRMADLLALQPNMEIALHIVAPDSRKEKVEREILRPVFSLLDSGPMSKRCSFIGYSQLDDLAKMPHLSHISDSIIEEFEEFFDD